MPIFIVFKATAFGGRNGRARSADDILDVILSAPKEIGGPVESGGRRGKRPERPAHSGKLRLPFPTLPAYDRRGQRHIAGAPMFRYAVHRLLPFAVEDVFNLVADVELYPEFVPGWITARVVARGDNTYGTDQTVRMRFLRQNFRTVTTLQPFEAIDVAANHPPFRRLSIQWRFRRQETGSFVSMEFLCEMRSRTFQALLNRFGPDDVEAMIAAFEHRAREILPRRA